MKKALTKAKTLAKKKVGRIAKVAAAAATRKMKETASKGAAAVVATSPLLKAITKQKIKKAVGVTAKHLLAGKPLNSQFMQSLFEHGTLT